jgi:CRISPR-associated protein Cas2
MPMTVVVTRDVPDRFRGFLASCMVEIAPGVYTSPGMTRGVRERVWTVLESWFGELGGGAVVMTWRDPSLPARQGVAILGEPAKTLVEHDGVLLVKRE